MLCNLIFCFFFFLQTNIGSFKAHHYLFNWFYIQRNRINTHFVTTLWNGETQKLLFPSTQPCTCWFLLIWWHSIQTGAALKWKGPCKSDGWYYFSKNSLKDFFKHDADMPSKISFVLEIELRTSLVANFPEMGRRRDGARTPPEKMSTVWGKRVECCWVCCYDD